MKSLFEGKVRRLVLAVVVGAAALGTGAGVAYATAGIEEPVETGYATVVDEGAAGADCPDGPGGTVPEEGQSNE